MWERSTEGKLQKLQGITTSQRWLTPPLGDVENAVAVEAAIAVATCQISTLISRTDHQHEHASETSNVQQAAETRQQRAIKTGAACNIIESNLRLTDWPKEWKGWATE